MLCALYGAAALPFWEGRSESTLQRTPLHPPTSPLLRRYDVTVVGYTGTTPSPTSNMLSFVTPAANAPLNTGTPQSPTLVLVKVVPPTLPPINGGSWCALLCRCGYVSR